MGEARTPRGRAQIIDKQGRKGLQIGPRVGRHGARGERHKVLTRTLALLETYRASSSPPNRRPTPGHPAVPARGLPARSAGNPGTGYGTTGSPSAMPTNVGGSTHGPLSPCGHFRPAAWGYTWGVTVTLIRSEWRASSRSWAGGESSEAEA